MASAEGQQQASSFAIVGYAARFPGAADIDEFWDVLRQGRDAVSEVPEDRWDVEEFFDPDPGAPGKVVTRRAGFVEDVTGFDAPFFRYVDARGQVLGPTASAIAGDGVAGGGAFGHRANGFGKHQHRCVHRFVHSWTTWEWHPPS